MDKSMFGSSGSDSDHRKNAVTNPESRSHVSLRCFRSIALAKETGTLSKIPPAQLDDYR
jgi:hypothetical protein